MCAPPWLEATIAGCPRTVSLQGENGGPDVVMDKLKDDVCLLFVQKKTG